MVAAIARPIIVVGEMTDATWLPALACATLPVLGS
jgi:hypothetical protein